MKKLFKKYGIHILIEIFIIVIGVLIALQVNNWNEARKQNRYTKGILTKVMQDWERDTNMINQFIKHYEPFIDGYNKVINQEVTDEYLDTCKVCRGLITHYLPFKIESNGIDLLKRQVNSDVGKIQSDSFITNLVQGQIQVDETIEQMSKRIQNDVDNNVLLLTEQEWFADIFIQGRMTKEFKEFQKSNIYRNRTARHKVFVESNIILFLKQYKMRIIEEFPKLKEKHQEL